MEKEKNTKAPPSVTAAIKLISLSNYVMGKKNFSGESGIPNVEELDLHEAQEEAFRSACQRLTRYFNKHGQRQDGRPQGVHRQDQD